MLYREDIHMVSAAVAVGPYRVMRPLKTETFHPRCRCSAVYQNLTASLPASRNEMLQDRCVTQAVCRLCARCNLIIVRIDTALECERIVFFLSKQFVYIYREFVATASKSSFSVAKYDKFTVTLRNLNLTKLKVVYFTLLFFRLFIA